MKHVIRLAQAPFDHLWERQSSLFTSPIQAGLSRGDIFEAYEMHGELPTGRVMVMQLQKIKRRADGRLFVRFGYMSNLFMKRIECRERLGIDEVWANAIMYGDDFGFTDRYNGDVPQLALEFAD
jgi:hypothetical protein